MRPLLDKFCKLLCVTITACSATNALANSEFHDLAYGNDPAQTLDVYAPTAAKGAPVIVMVHGGAWRFGAKDNRGVVQHKVAHWVNNGYVFTSLNYRMLPAADLLTQSQDIVSAIQFVQANAASWGGDPAQVILMGHSAGAHLVALVNAQASAGLLDSKIAYPWLGSIALDSAVYDVVKVMRATDTPRLYKRAFGEDPAIWQAVSPLHVLAGKIPPLLLVCSEKRPDEACDQASQFKLRVESFGSDVRVLTKTLSHRDINVLLGKDEAYTSQVDAFLQLIQKNRS